MSISHYRIQILYLIEIQVYLHNEVEGHNNILFPMVYSAVNRSKATLAYPIRKLKLLQLYHGVFGF